LADDGPGAHKNTRIASVEVPHATTGYHYLTNLVRCASALFLEAEVDPPPALVRCIESSDEQIRGAYAASVSEVTAEFWSELLCYAPFAPMDQPLDFEGHRTFLKLVPIPQRGQPPPPPENYAFGMLAYTKGMDQEAKDYCIRATREEKEQHPHRPVNVPYGLRFPRTTDEEALNLHVLQVSACGVIMAGRLCCFGNRAAPGKPVCLHSGATMPRLVFQLVRFDAEFCANKFVLPVTQFQVDSGNKHERESQWDAVFTSIFQYHEVWGLEAKYAPEKVPPSPFGLTDAYPPASREDALFAAMVGVVRNGPSRLGDIYEQVKKLKYAAPHVTRFLTCAITEHGADTAVSEALDGMVQSHMDHGARLQELKEKLQKAEHAEERLKAAAPKKAELPPVSKQQVLMVLNAMGRKPKKGRVMPQPMTSAGVLGVVFAYANARGAPENKADAKWGKKNALELTTFDAISKIVGQLDAGPVVLMRLNADDTADFLRPRTEARTAERIPALEAMELSLKDDVAFLHFHVNDQKLSPLPRA